MGVRPRHCRRPAYSRGGGGFPSARDGFRIAVITATENRRQAPQSSQKPDESLMKTRAYGGQTPALLRHCLRLARRKRRIRGIPSLDARFWFGELTCACQWCHARHAAGPVPAPVPRLEADVGHQHGCQPCQREAKARPHGRPLLHVCSWTDGTGETDGSD
jgi:hypothetical protein